MFDLMGMLVSGVLSGGATGLIGVLIQRWFDFKNRQQDIEIVKLNLANAVELSKLESDRANVRAQVELELSENELEQRTIEAENTSLQMSYAADQATYLNQSAQSRAGWVGNLIVLMMALVDFARGMLRPGMTIYLCVLVTLMFAWAKQLADQYGVHITERLVMDVITQIIATILYVFTTITLWWFGSRPPKGKTDK